MKNEYDIRYKNTKPTIIYVPLKASPACKYPVMFSVNDSQCLHSFVNVIFF